FGEVQVEIPCKVVVANNSAVDYNFDSFSSEATDVLPCAVREVRSDGYSSIDNQVVADFIKRIHRCTQAIVPESEVESDVVCRSFFPFAIRTQAIRHRNWV